MFQILITIVILLVIAAMVWAILGATTASHANSQGGWERVDCRNLDAWWSSLGNLGKLKWWAFYRSKQLLCALEEQ